MGILDATRKGKQTDGEQMSILDQLQAELAGLALEDSACERTSTDYNASVDAIERALVRRQAIAVRTSVLERKIATERARVKEEERAALQAKGEALKAKTRLLEANLQTPMVNLFTMIGQLQEALLVADGLIAQAWKESYPYNGVTPRTVPMQDLRMALAKQLVAQNPERFQWTTGGLVDKEGAAK